MYAIRSYYDKIVCICLSEKGKKISVYNLFTKMWIDITDETYEDISLPKWKDNHTILFTAGYSGTEEIYSVNIESRLVKQITQSKFGSTGAIYDSKNGIFIYSMYASNGYQLVKTSEKDVHPIPFKYIQNNSIKLYEKISDQEQQPIDFIGLDTIPDYQISNYS